MNKPQLKLFQEDKFIPFTFFAHGISYLAFVSKDVQEVENVMMQEYFWRTYGRSGIGSSWRCFFGGRALATRYQPDIKFADNAYAMLYFVQCPVLDLVEFSQLGTFHEHIEIDSDAWRGVQKYLKDIYSLAPFDIMYIDEAGMHALFCEKLDEDKILRIEKIIEEVAPFSGENGGGAVDENGNASIADFIRLNNAFHLFFM